MLGYREAKGGGQGSDPLKGTCRSRLESSPQTLEQSLSSWREPGERGGREALQGESRAQIVQDSAALQKARWLSPGLRWSHRRVSI